MPIYQLGEWIPQIAPSAWVAPNASVIGRVQVDADASVWFGTVIRADNGDIRIGEGCNIQDNCVLHGEKGTSLTIEAQVSVGHQAIVHGAYVGQGTMIGMQSVLLSRCRIGAHCLVGAGSLIPEDQVFPDGVLIIGHPARIIRKVSEEEIRWMRDAQQGMVEKARFYRAECRELNRELNV